MKFFHWKFFLAVFVFVVILVCAWAPWISVNGGERALRIVTEEFDDAQKQVVGADGNILCDGLYSIWIPFGQWVSNCENAWVVTFWGQIFEKSPPAYEERQKNVQRGPVTIGYVGCSNTSQTVEGYHRVGGAGMWPYDKRYDAGAVIDWARNAESGNKYWNVFDDRLEENPETNIIWWELCIREDEAARTEYNHAADILAEIRKRIPGAVVYVTPLPPYTNGVCGITGLSGIERARTLAQEIDENNSDVFPGPVLGPMTPQDTDNDGCHLSSPDGKKKLGEQMKAFFDTL